MMPLTREGTGQVKPMDLWGRITLILDGAESRVEVEDRRGVFYTIPFHAVTCIRWEPKKAEGQPGARGEGE